MNKVVHLWNLKLDIEEYSFDKQAFGPEQEKNKLISKPNQPTLWEALDSVGEEDLRLTVKRVGKSLRVSVKIEIPA